MKNVKKMAILLSAALLSMPFPLSAFAATGTAVSSVSIRINSEIVAGDSGSDVSVTTSSAKYSIDDYTVTNEPSDEWEDGDKPKLKVILEAADDYYFASGFSKSDVNLTGDDDSTCTSVSRTSSTLTVYITLDALEDDSYDLDVEGLEWDEGYGWAYWNDVDDAARYEVRLYRGSTAVTSVMSTTATQYNFASYLTASGYYTVKVRAVYSSSNKGDWSESDSWYVSSSLAEELSSSASSGSSGTSTGPGETGSSSGAWLKDDVGWWYCNADRSYTVNNWQYINNSWYFFNETGYMKTGWVNWNSKWYYLSDSGAMLSGTVTPDGYTVDSNGVWVQ